MKIKISCIFKALAIAIFMISLAVAPPPASIAYAVDYITVTDTERITCTGNSTNYITVKSWQGNTCSRCGYVISMHILRCPDCGREFEYGACHCTGSPAACTGYYKNSDYWYSGDRNSFKAYQLSVTNNSPHVLVTGAGSSYYNDFNKYVAEGAIINIVHGWSPEDYNVFISIDGGAEQKLSLSVSGTLYQFVMPSSACSISIRAEKQPQAVSVATPLAKTYNQLAFNLDAIVS